MIKIERGILIADYKMRLRVMSIGCIHRLNYTAFFYDNCKVGDKVLGVMINNQYNVCYKFTTKKNKSEKIFGFLIPDEFSSSYTVQTIDEFDPNNIPFDLHLIDYPLGEKIKIEMDELLKVGFN